MYPRDQPWRLWRNFDRLSRTLANGRRIPAHQSAHAFLRHRYVVEGIGQARVGVIFQPLNNYLKVYRMDSGSGHRLSRHPQLPVDHQAGFRPRLRFRPAVWLSAKELSDPVEHLWRGRLCLDRSTGRAQRVRVVARPHLLRHATSSTLCGALLAENGQSLRLSSTFVSQQWLWFYIAIMASAFAGGCAGRASAAPVGFAGCRRYRGRCVHSDRLCGAVPSRRAENHGESRGNARHASKRRHGVEVPRSCTSSPCSFFCIPSPLVSARRSITS